ncbi:hypothetical protein BH23CHL2_BH23CHL2_25010 [soil metagenome]
MTALTDIRAALDPAVLFAEQVGTPDQWQRDVLRSTAPRVLLNCCRQSGKSEVAATLGIHAAMFTPRSLVVLLSPSLRQSRELFAKALAVYRAVGAAVPAEVENRLELELSNGSRLVALPGKEQTIRGFSGAALILVDEASRVPDELYRAIRPMVAVSGGRIVALSTPWGKRGWWWQAWESGGDTWQRVQITAEQCPRISPEFLEEERQELGPLWYQSEYECRFVDTSDAVFRSEEIDRALTFDVTPLFGGG